MKAIKKFLGKLFAPFVNDPSYHYYYTEPVDKRGSTTYPPEDSGPSDLAIYGTIALLMLGTAACVRKHLKSSGGEADCSVSRRKKSFCRK